MKSLINFIIILYDKNKCVKLLITFLYFCKVLCLLYLSRYLHFFNFVILCLHKLKITYLTNNIIRNMNKIIHNQDNDISE